MGVPEEEVQVTTFYPGGYRFAYASYDAVSRSLLLCTDTAVYRLPTAGLGAGPAHVQQPVLLAGSEEEEGSRDGRGAEARFNDIWAMAVDGTGTAWVLDRAGTPMAEATRLARVDPDGTVTSVPVYLPGMYFSLAVLRDGCLALVPEGRGQLLRLPLGLTPCCTPPSPGSDCGSSCGP